MVNIVIAQSESPAKPACETPSIDMGHRPILVTGAHRSGTTWLGRLLSAARGVGLIYEPMNYRWRRPGVCSVPWPSSYTYICRDNEAEVLEPLRRTLGFHYSIRRELPAVRGRMARDWTTSNWHRAAASRPLVKDPNAVFSAEWFAERLGTINVIIVRHPAAFANSLRRRNWVFPFEKLVRQERLIHDHLQPFQDRIAAFAADPPSIERQAGLIWSIIYTVVSRYRKTHPDWVFLRHEDAAARPRDTVACLYARLGLEPGRRTARVVDRLTHAAGDGGRPSQPLHWMKRDSAKVADEWRGELKGQQVDEVRSEVTSVYDEFYRPEDWEGAVRGRGEEGVLL